MSPCPPHNRAEPTCPLCQFSGLLALSFILDFFWQTSSETNGFCRFLLLVNWCLKPITLLAALGHLRQRGQPTFAFPGGISLPTNFSLPGGYPTGGQSQTGECPPGWLRSCGRQRVAQLTTTPHLSQSGTRSRSLATSPRRPTSSSLKASTTTHSSSSSRPLTRPRSTSPRARDRATTPSSETHCRVRVLACNHPCGSTRRIHPRRDPRNTRLTPPGWVDARSSRVQLLGRNAPRTTPVSPSRKQASGERCAQAGRATARQRNHFKHKILASKAQDAKHANLPFQRSLALYSGQSTPYS